MAYGLIEALGFGGPDPALVSDGTRTRWARRSSCQHSVFARRDISKSHVRTALVVIDPPRFDQMARIVDRFKPMHVQAFVAQRPVKRPDEGIVRGLAWP